MVSDDGFLFGLSSLGVFSTATQGDIHYGVKGFTFSKNLPVHSYPNNLYPIIKYFLQHSQKDQTTSFTLPPMTFNTNEEFEEFILLLKKMNGLVSCDVSQAKLDKLTYSENGLALKLLRLTSLQKLDLPMISFPIKEFIIKSWRIKHANNLKGLRFISNP